MISVRAIKLALLLTLISVVLVGCSNKIDNVEDERYKYELSNGKIPTEIQDIIKDSILDIYMPSKESDIERGVDKLSDIATETEINTLKETIGAFDEDNKATVNNLNVSICMPENSTDNKTKYLVTFEISNDQILADMLIEFGCNNEDKISSHSIWVDYK